MEAIPNDETIEEILKEEQTEIKKSKKNKSCFARTLILIILLAVCFFGFVYIQQYLLDLEAEAIVRAAQTATALGKESAIKDDLATEDIQIDTATPVQQPTLTEAEISDSAIARTATIAVQLTSVAEFQNIATETP